MVDFDLNSTLGPVIDGMIAIMPTLLQFIINIVPIVVTMSFVSFFVAFPEKILAMIKL